METVRCVYCTNDVVCVRCAYAGAYRVLTPEEIMDGVKQPLPLPGRVKVIDRVHQDLQKRSIFGYQKYGTYLMTGNGRDALLDAYEESLDLVQYLAQCILERAGE